MAGRLPHHGITDFVGRQDELSRLTAMLNRSRLVTVVGPGGVGKTRLARVTAAGAMENYPDGVWIVELSGLRDQALLLNTVASVLGLPEQDTRSALGTVLEYLREKRLLLILDTCEHMLDQCAELVQAVLVDAPGVAFLATSRQPLDTPGEQNFAIQPLPVPDDDADADLGRGDAVELFALRAAAAVPGFTVDRDNAAAVIRLCRRLDGIPLAVELAAVQLRALALDELVRRLDRRFAVLTGGQPGALERHQTLRTAIEWSYELCSLAERRLWARLSVFAGTFSLAAAEAVCAEVEIERPEVVDALIGLVDKSVVLHEGTRYRMLDTLREFGAERLAASGEEAACRARHIERYLAMARYFGDHFTDDDQMERYRELRQTHANLRAALEYALDDPVGSPVPAVTSGAAGMAGPAERAGAEGAPDGASDGASDGSDGSAARWRSGLDMACSLYGYWQISGLLSEGGYWLTKALERFADSGRERARALVNRGFLRSFQGEIPGAQADLETGIALAIAAGDEPTTARGYQHLHLVLTFFGRHQEALEMSADARRRLQACGDRHGELMLMAQLGHLYALSGHIAESVATCEEGLAMLGPDTGEQWLQSYLLQVEGFALFQVPGREADCELAVRKALAGEQKLGDIIGMGYGLDILGWLSAKTGAPERTAWALGAADPLWERGGLRFSGTQIMMDFHREAARAAAKALGKERYDLLHAAGVDYMNDWLKDLARGDSVELSIP